jgi:hypothetical protein
MTSYTFSDKAKVEGGVLITRRDGTMFEILPVPRKELPLDVRGVGLDLTADEIVGLIRETRKR